MPIGIILVLLAAGGIYFYVEKSTSDAGKGTSPEKLPTSRTAGDLNVMYANAMNGTYDVQATAYLLAIIQNQYPGQFPKSEAALKARITYLQAHPGTGTH